MRRRLSGSPRPNRARRRTACARQYLDALVQRDVRDVAGIDRLDQLLRLLWALAQIAGQMCNYKLGGHAFQCNSISC